MKMRVLFILALALCATATEVSEKKEVKTAPEHNAEKRQAQEGTYSHLQYRTARKQEQVAPVEEPQDDDKGLRNRTSLQPTSEDQGSKVERPPREQPPNQPANTEQSTTAPMKEQKTSDQPSSQKEVNVEVVNDQAQQITHMISIEHRGLSLEDRRNSHIPPPRDGKSYTPEEFTSLIVSGFAVTPIPDYNGFDGSINSVTSARPPQYASTPLIYNQNLPVSSTISPSVAPLRDPTLRLDPSKILGQYRQSLATLPPPQNGKFYTPVEYNELIAAGYPVTAVPVNALTFGVPQSSRSEPEQYRPGQVFSLNPRELLELQQERKAPVANNQLLQQLYINPQQDHKQNFQQIYYLEPQQTGRQVPSHAVIARPQYDFNGGEASVGAALSVSDNGGGSTDSFDHELLALLGQPQVRAESHAQAYSPAPQQSTTVRSVAPQYQQVDRYVSKPSKKSSKVRSKVHVSFPQPTEAPQQYLIETTNVQQQQAEPRYRPTPQPQRLAQSLRYVPIAQAQAQQEFAYERPDQAQAQGLKIVPAPKLQQLRPQLNYRIPAQYQQQEASPKQYRIIELPQQLKPQSLRQELRFPSSSIERPVAFLKRYQELEKQRSVKIYDPVAESVSQQPAQLYGEQFVLRPIYRTNEQQQPRYELSAKAERVAQPTKAPHSAIYVNKNLAASRKVRPQLAYRDQADIEQVNIEQHGRDLDEQRSQLPPPKNNKAYTPEEFAALVAAGYSVTPVPVSAANLDAAQSRISEESVTPQPRRRLTQRRRNQYLPVRDDAP